MDDFLQIAERVRLRAPDIQPVTLDRNTWRRPRPALAAWPVAHARGRIARLRRTPASVKGHRTPEREDPLGGPAGFRDRLPRRRNLDPASGEPLMHLCHESQHAQPGLGRQVEGHNPVANHREARINLIEDEDIEALASVAAQRAFPETPVRGIDIVRAAADDSQHVCEVNVYGKIWHFSSERGRVLQQVRGLDLYTPQNALDTSSGRLITASWSHAR